MAKVKVILAKKTNDRDEFRSFGAKFDIFEVIPSN